MDINKLNVLETYIVNNYFHIVAFDNIRIYLLSKRGTMFRTILKDNLYILLLL